MSAATPGSTLNAFDTPAAEEAGLTSAGFDRDNILRLLETDLNFFAATVISNVFRFLFPQVHVEIWELLKKHVGIPGSFFKLALGLPRGHAKTTLIKLFIVYCVLFTQKRFILIVGSTSTLAENILSDVMKMLSSDNVVQIFGNWQFSVETNTQELKHFTFLGRSIVIAAIGAGTSTRGVNLGLERPDVIICDDVQKKEDVKSKVLSEALLEWLVGTLFKTKSPNGCLYVYIGNMYRGEGCILAMLKKSREWISFVVGALLADGNSIWPELHSPENLMAELRHDMDMGKPEIFFAEVQNDPDAGVSGHFDISKIPQYTFTDQDLVTSGFILIDLAGNKVNSDATTVGYFCQIETKWVFRALTAGRFSPLEAIDAAVALGWKYNCPYIFVESVAYQASFLFWFDFLCNQRGISGFQLNEIYPRGIAKNKRIISFFKQLLAGDIHLHPDVRAQVLYQAATWNPNKTDNEDDIIDLGGYVDFVLSDYAPMLATPVQELLESFMNETKTIEDCSAF